MDSTRHVIVFGASGHLFPELTEKRYNKSKKTRVVNNFIIIMCFTQIYAFVKQNVCLCVMLVHQLRSHDERMNQSQQLDAYTGKKEPALDNPEK